MLPLRSAPAWTIRRRQRFLASFRRDVERYFARVTYEAFPFRVVESDEARDIRRSLESRIPRCRRIVAAAESVTMERQASGARPGDVTRVNLVDAAFQLDRYDLAREDLLRVFDAADAAHVREARAAWLRMANPLYWLDMTLSVAEVAPFVPLKLLGKDPARAALTTLGSAARVGVRLAVLAALAWALLAALGWREEATLVFRSLIAKIARPLPIAPTL